MSNISTAHNYPQNAKRRSVPVHAPQKRQTKQHEI